MDQLTETWPILIEDRDLSSMTELFPTPEKLSPFSRTCFVIVFCGISSTRIDIGLFMASLLEVLSFGLNFTTNSYLYLSSHNGSKFNYEFCESAWNFNNI